MCVTPMSSLACCDLDILSKHVVNVKLIDVRQRSLNTAHCTVNENIFE